MAINDKRWKLVGAKVMDLKIKDVSELLNVSETTIRRWLSEGRIPAYRLNHQYRFSRIEIENWMLTLKVDNKPSLKSLKEKKESSDVSIKKGSQQFSFYRAVHRGDVITDIDASSKEDLIAQTMERVAQKLNFDPDVVTELLMDREKMMPTALNSGIAVPHTREFTLKGNIDAIVIVLPNKPINWGALDGKPVDVLFFLFSSNDKRHLHLLAKIAHLSSNEEAIELLQSRPEKGELLSYLKKWESTVQNLSE